MTRRASLQAIGSAAKAGALAAAAAIGPLGFAFIGVTAAASAFAFIMRDRIPDATETMEDHSRILDQVARRYDGIAEVLAQIDRRASIGIEIELGANTDDLREVMAAQIRQLERDFIGAGGWLGTPGASAPIGGGFVYQNAQGQTVNSMGLTRGQQIMGGVGAGLGIFSQGVQSGSVGMGALSGGLGGFQAAGALGIAGPVGFVAGAALGALGGLFGNRQKREQEHRQHQQAWEQMAPQWAAFREEVATGTGPTSGLRSSQSAMVDQFSTFVRAGDKAWKYGSDNSSDLHAQVTAQLAEYFARTNAEFGAHVVGDRLRNEVRAVLEGRRPEPALVEPTDAPKAKAPKLALTGVVTASVLLLRNRPDGDVIGRMPAGTRLRIVDHDRGWADVITPAGYSGSAAFRFIALD